jgi:hypothetical protein
MITKIKSKNTGAKQTKNISIKANIKDIDIKGIDINLNETVDYELNEIDRNDDNTDEIHYRIHPDLKFTLNSINVIVERTGAGKARFIFREISKLRYLVHPYTQLLMITDEENDKTYLKYKELIDIPVVQINYKNAFEEITNIIKAKNMYELIRSDKQKAPDEEKKELLTYLSVENFDLPFLHTLILFDDAKTIFYDVKNPLNSLILRNRHSKITYFFNVHLFTKNAVPMYIKKNMRALFYFGGYSSQDFNNSFPQFRSPISRVQLYEIYREVNNHSILYFDYDDEKTNVEVINLM